jgi:hypothetical protein
MPRSLAGIHKLYIAILEQAEFQSLRGIIDLGRDNGISEIQLVGILFVHIEQRRTFGKTLGDVVVLTSNLKHSGYMLIIGPRNKSTKITLKGVPM